MELVSIIMPTHNCAPFIKESIDSVIAQTYTEWELIVVDDGSVDNTAEIVNGYGNERIRYLHNDRRMGAALTRNRALREAKGRYIALLDSDDVWEPMKLERQIDFMQKNNYAFTYHDYIEIDETSTPLGIYVSGKRHVTPFDMKSCCWPGCLTVMYDQRVIGMIQIADIQKDNDSAIWLQAIQKADCYLLPENLARYRRRRGSLTPLGIAQKIGWHYVLFRHGAHKSRIASVFWMCMNIIGNGYKKIRYVRRY